MQLLVRRVICSFLIFFYFIYLFIIIYLFFFKFLASNPPLHIIHARISNNLNKEFITMTKFTIHVQCQRSFVLKNSQLSYFACLRSHQIIVLVSMLLEFAEQSRFLYRVSVDFGSRLLPKHGSAFEIIS